MMKNTLITIDSYLSNLERAYTCSNLIKQIREVFGKEYSILLINKSNNDFGLQNEVDYYINLSNSFLVGYPPQHILDNDRYERPYVYVNISFGTCENWLPLTGVTDHVGGIYNSFIISSNISKMLGLSNVFKIEYDTIFDLEELHDIKLDIEKEKDFIFYGTRKEGEYAKNHHYLVDLHIVGYSNKIFDGFNIIYNSEEYWNLCDRINYYGKWIEYVIPSIFEYQKNTNEYDGIEYDIKLRKKYPNTKFDIINGVGGWTEKWKSIPKVCNLKNTQEENSFGLFYWNQEHDEMNIQTVVKNEFGEIIHEKNLNLFKNHYSFDLLKFETEKIIIEKKNTILGVTEEFIEIITRESIENSNVQFKYND
jgi:hypothetical protein